MIANKKTLLALSVASALTLSGCFSDDDNNTTVTPPPPEPTDPVVVAPETPEELSFVVAGNVVNSDFDVVAAQVTLLENGELSDNTVDVNGEPVNVIDASEGSFTFTLKEGASIDTITANVTAEGYISKSFVVDLTVAEGQTTIAPLFELVAKNAEGIADEVVEAAVTDATTAEPINAVAESGQAGANVTVPANTQLLDANNNPVTGTNISLNVTAADGTSTNAGAIVPEGLNEAGATEVKTPVAVANIVMTDDQGNKIKNFSQPIEVTMAIPASTTLSTGEAISTGDELTLTSHNEDTGVWVTEDSKVVVGALNEANNTYTGSFMTDHLTFFSAVKRVEACTAGVTLNVSGDDVPARGLYATFVSRSSSSTAPLWPGATSIELLSPALAARSSVSADTTGLFRVFDINGQVWFSSEEVAICGEVDANLTNPVTLVSEGFSVNAVCENDTSVTTPLTGAVVIYGLAGKAPLIANGTGGTYQLEDLVETSTYEVTVIPRGDQFAGVGAQDFTITADGTDESAEITVQCDEATGS